jgi:predicted aminopeptidase
MKQLFRKIHWIGLFEILITVILLWNFSIINYGMMQLKGQMNILMNARPVIEVLADPDVSDSIKQKLILIGEIREFAVKELGISPSENYTTFYDQKGEPILWVMTACEPFEFKAFEWKYPFLGNLAYKGFFNLEKALVEQNFIKKKGLDGELGKVSAWSTLGYFKDPVLSDMLLYNEGNLANLIIHELTHGTLYVKGDVDFNENLANFIGDKGAIKFLTYKYGSDSEQMKSYLEERHDEQLFTNYIIDKAKELEIFYSEIQHLPYEVKYDLKDKRIEEVIDGIINLNFFRSERYAKAGEKILKQKNAYFMSFIRYNAKFDDFENELINVFNNDLKAYLLYLKLKYPSV